MVDVNKLKYKIEEKEKSIESLAKKMGIRESILYSKLNNSGKEITIKEADIFVKELELTELEAFFIFFT